MRSLISLIIISLIAGIAILGILPGCDELVTKENYIYDTTTNIIWDSNCVAICHSDINNSKDIAIRQWENSAHSSRGLVDAALLGENTLTCGPQCHTREGFVQLLTGSSPGTNYSTEIGCFACHAPHTTWNWSLRDTSALTLNGSDDFAYHEANICARCHQSLADSTAEMVHDSVTIDTSWAIWALHGSFQAEMLGGFGGYEYPGVTYVHSQHRTQTDKGCVTCHQDSARGFTLGGHSLNLRNESDMLVEACNRTGCHIGAPFDAAAIEALQSILAAKLDSLKSKLIEDSLLDEATGEPMIGIEIADAETAGALYNYFFVLNDKSLGMHNWAYDTLLIRNSLDHLYGDTL